jgi:hypothetical protein
MLCKAESALKVKFFCLCPEFSGLFVSALFRNWRMDICCAKMGIIQGVVCPFPGTEVVSGADGDSLVQVGRDGNGSASVGLALGAGYFEGSQEYGLLQWLGKGTENIHPIDAYKYLQLFAGRFKNKIYDLFEYSFAMKIQIKLHCE